MAKRDDALGDMLSAAMSMGVMLLEAQTVIVMRMWGMAGLWNLGPQEKQRMWKEKASAARQSGQALTRAVLSGATPAEAALAAIEPVRRKTRANVRRLTRRGPGRQG